MSETDAIVGIYGAVDRAVQEDPQARARVATLLKQYKDPQFHWFDEFQKWLDISEPQRTEDPSAQLKGALDELADTQPSRPHVRGRRMFAVGVAARAFSPLQKPRHPLAKLAVKALHPDSFGVAKPEQAAQGVYDLLRQDGVPQPAGAEPCSWWDSVIDAAVMDGPERLLPSRQGMHAGACCSELVTVPGVAGPVAALKTEFETTDIRFRDAIKLLEPLNWKDCMPHFWREVRMIGREQVPGQRVYHEVVGSDSEPGAQPLFTAETDLLFNFIWLPAKERAQAALVNYQLAPGRPLPNDLIRVDEGTLLVAKVNRAEKHLRITTTKRIQFNYPFSSEMLAMVTCALGYADVGASLACCTARLGKNPVDSAGRPLPEFPGVSPTAATMGGASSPRRTAPSGSPRRFGQANRGALAQDAVDIWARTLRDSAAAFERSAGRQRQAQDRQRD
jgi:hypothetical protein